MSDGKKCHSGTDGTAALDRICNGGRDDDDE
jgi:hypothetical protein